MPRLGFLMVAAGALGSLACQMPNPEFDEPEAETRDSLDGAEAAEGKETGEGSEAEASGDGDGDSGDGDPAETGSTDTGTSESTSGDGDGDGDGDPGDGDGDPNTTGDGDGDPNMQECPNLIGNLCQLCATEHCCQPGIELCFQTDTDCKCLLDCTGGDLLLLEDCVGMCEADPAVAELVQDFAPCMARKCGNACG
jgi:hypothetical protein